METLFFIIFIILFGLSILSGLATFIAIVDWGHKGQEIFPNPWQRLMPVAILCASSVLSYHINERSFRTTALIKTPIVHTQIGVHKINGIYLENKFIPLCNGENIDKIFERNRKDKDIPEILSFESSLCFSDTLYIYRITKKNGLGVPLSSQYEIFGSRNKEHDIELVMNGVGPEPTKEKTK